MRTLVALVLTAGLALTAAGQDAKDLDGEYTAVTATVGGKDLGEKFAMDVQGVTLKDGVFTIKMKDVGDKSAKLKFDATKKPGHVDITPTDGPQKDKTIPGIYASEKGELKMAWVEAGPDKTGDRPKDFTSTAENRVMVITLKKK